MHHGLLVAAEHVAQVRLGAGLDRRDLVLQQRLAEAGDVAVAEDAEGAGEELGALAVVLDVLVAEEPNGGLRDGESHGGFAVGDLLGPLGCGGNHRSCSCRWR